jgi:hypothetical protein
MPAQAGIQVGEGAKISQSLDSRFRGKDGEEEVGFKSIDSETLGFEARESKAQLK